MHVLLTGASGTIGRDTLIALLDNAAVQKVTTISRSDLDTTSLPSSSTDKLNTLRFTEDDFIDPPPSAREHFKTVNAVVWSLAITPTKALQTVTSEAELRKVSCTYLRACLDAVVQARKDGGGNGQLTIVYISGVAVARGRKLPENWDESHPMTTMLLVRGESEALAHKYADPDSNPPVKVHVAKPGPVAPAGEVEEHTAKTRARGFDMRAIDIRDLVAALVGLAVHGGSIVEDGWDGDELMHEQLRAVGGKARGVEGGEK